MPVEITDIIQGFANKMNYLKNLKFKIMEDNHIVILLMSYAKFTGAKDLFKLPGLWVKAVDDNWTIKCNGHDKEIEKVPPFSWFIEYNGWPAGILTVMGDGFLCAGENGNETNLKKALEKAMQ